MPNMNRVTLLGHLVRDAELRYTNSGKAVTNMTIAVNDNYTDDTAFVDITLWNRGNYKLAEYRANDSKGDLVLIDGKLKQDNWKNKNGDNRSKLKVVADKAINFSQKKSDNTQNNQQSNQQNEDFDAPF